MSKSSRKESVQERALAILNRNRGSFFSGQELADELGVTRAAVWKAVEKLREEGCEIKAVTNRGYALGEDSDVLNRDSVAQRLSDAATSFYHKLIFLKETTSTNDYIQERYASEAEEGLVVSAEYQTQGKGRYGRSFYSPRGTGIYFSLLLKPNCEAQYAIQITVAAAGAGISACEKVAQKRLDEEVKIKWVNDLYLRDKKICGILTEGTASVETGKMERAILGVGFNLTVDDDCPEDLRRIAGGLFAERAPVGARAALMGAFLNDFYGWYERLFKRGDDEQTRARQELLKEYRARQFLVGKKIDVLNGGREPTQARAASAVGIDDNFRLLVCYDDEPFKIVALNSGEARVRQTASQTRKYLRR